MFITKTCPTCGELFTCGSSRQNQTYCSRSCRSRDIATRTNRRGPDNPNFKGGWQSQNRYRLWVPQDERHLHPTCNKNGYILRYHKVWNDAHPDDKVQRGQVVHHINGDSLDDRLENLEKMPSQSPHAEEHFRRSRGPLSQEHKAKLSAVHRAKFHVPDRDCEQCGRPLRRDQIVRGCVFCSTDCMYKHRTGKPMSDWKTRQ